MSQCSAIALKRVYISMYALINLNVCHIKVKTRTSSKKLRSKRVHHKTKKSLYYYRFFKVLIIQYHSSAFNKGFHQKQAVNYLLQYYENSYIQKLIFVKDFCRYLNISFFILVCCFFIIFFLVFSFKLSCMCVFFCF